MLTFEPNPYGTNELLNGDGFYVSYNAAPCAGMSVLEADGRSAETALAIENGLPDGRTAWLILNGDFRRDYEEAFPRGIEACVAVYEANRAAHRSSWSVDGDWTVENIIDWLRNRAEVQS